MRKTVATLSALAAITTGIGYTATHAHAAPVSDMQVAEMSIRMQLVGITPHPGIDTTARAVCSALAEHPDAVGKATALEVARAAGYTDPFATGYVTGVSATVLCPGSVRILTETPMVPAPKAEPVLKSVASPQENTAAMANFQGVVGVGTVTGTVVGGTIGAVGGCVAASLVPAATGVGLVIVPATCLAGAVAGAAAGSALGALALGGPAAVIAGVDLVTALTAPAGTTAYAVK